MLPFPVQLHDFQAFSCTSCGRCCRPWQVSLQGSERLAIEASSAYQQRLRPGYRPITVEEPGVGELGDRGDGHCTFLKPDNLCQLHAEIGGRNKPLGCQLYPYQTVRTPDGIFAYLSFGCPPVVAGQALDVALNRAELEEMLQGYTDPLENSSESPFLVDLTSSVALPWAAYLRLEGDLVQEFEPQQPIASCLHLAANLLAWERTGAADLTARLAPDDLQFSVEIVRKFVSSMISAVENIEEDSERRRYALEVESGESVESERFDLRLPPLCTAEPTQAFVLEVYSKYFRNAILGKAALKSTVVARLYTMACELILTGYYTEAYRVQRGLPEWDLTCLTDGFGLVEYHHGIHSPVMGHFGLAMEETFRSLQAADSR